MPAVKRRSVITWVTDALRACGVWTLVILIVSVAAGALTLILFDRAEAKATTELGFVSEAESVIDTETAQSVFDQVESEAFVDEIHAALERAGTDGGANLSASSDPLADSIEIHGRAEDAEVADQASIFAADAIVAWSQARSGSQTPELTILGHTPAETPDPKWPAALIVTLTIGSFSMVLLVASRKSRRQLRFSRDLSPAHRDVPVIGGADTDPETLLRNTTAVLSRIGRENLGESTVVAIVGMTEAVPARMIDVFERRLAAADSAVRLQAVRGISSNIARFSAVLLSGPSSISAERVSAELDLVVSADSTPACVLLGGTDAIDQHSGSLLGVGRKTQKTPSVEVTITDPTDQSRSDQRD
jgi:hypothetical protein